MTLGRSLGLDMPSKVSIVGIAVEGDFQATDLLSPEVERAIPEAVERVLRELDCTSLP